MFRTGSVTLFRVRGVPIRAHWTLLLLVPYVAIVLAYQVPHIAEMAGIDRHQLVLPPLAWGAIVAIALVASIALHELAHTFVATRFGGRVSAITLMLVGGLSHLQHPPARAIHEAEMAAAGPIASLALGAIAFAAYLASWLPADVRMTLAYVAVMNGMLGVFNLLPAFPMDGGRLLRALLSIRLGRTRATAIAATFGKACAVAFGVYGMWSTNLVLTVVAVFVYLGAQGEANAEAIRAGLAGVRIADLVGSRPAPLIAADAGTDVAIERMRDLGRLELVAVDRDGAPVAVVDSGDLETPLASRVPVRFVTAEASEPAALAVARAGLAGVTYIVAVDPAGHALGLISGDDIDRVLRLTQAASSLRGPRSCNT
jgi:Zn-dependent protease